MRDIFKSFALSTHDSPDRAANLFNDDIEAGARTLIVAVRDYNGAADDTDVTVGLIASEGLDSASDGGPRWDGTDMWSHTDKWLSGPTLPLSGYVKDHVLVTRPTNLVMSFGGFSLRLRLASIVGTIDPVAPGRLLDGVVIGRGVANELIAASGQLPVQGERCAISTSPLAIATICGARDIGSSAGGDASATCDSISVAMGFSAVGAGINPAAQKDPDGGACDAALTCNP